MGRLDTGRLSADKLDSRVPLVSDEHPLGPDHTFSAALVCFSPLAASVLRCFGRRSTRMTSDGIDWQFEILQG